MSEARAVTNFAGNAVATLLVATWTRELDRGHLASALSGERPFDEATMLDDDGHGSPVTAPAAPAGDAPAAERELAGVR
jgi:aerobic C4-dicarboxylate transport protein